MTLPAQFCWTRFGTEAGQAIDDILARKEKERVANGGRFLWGVGNAVGPSIQRLIQSDPEPAVLFSPMKSRPALQDELPATLLAWTEARTMDGTVFSVPPSFLVTSRDIPGGNKRVHYALVCWSEGPLIAGDRGSVDLRSLSNLISGKPIGASQVTAVVATRPGEGSNACYPVALRASLVPPYFLTLRSPAAVSRLNESQTWSEAVSNHWMDSLTDRWLANSGQNAVVPAHQLSFAID